MLRDNDILIDAGTRVGDLSLNELTWINHAFVGHSYLDHVSPTPFLVATVEWMRNMPITVQTTRATQNILRQRSINWKIRPDFTHIPGPREVEECAADHEQEMLRHKQNFMFQAGILHRVEMRF
jgi:hypothetical protein